MILVCAHAGLKTGEDGPTHADPQPLQLLQENFPTGTAISLTPWDPQEIWTAHGGGAGAAPGGHLVPFVTRPSETVLDRADPGPGAGRSGGPTGVYRAARDRDPADGTVVLQESAVAYAFVERGAAASRGGGRRPLRLLRGQRRAVRPRCPRSGGGSCRSRAARPSASPVSPCPRCTAGSPAEGGPRALHPFRTGHFLGSGQGEMVLAEAGLDGEGQYQAISAFVGGKVRI